MIFSLFTIFLFDKYFIGKSWHPKQTKGFQVENKLSQWAYIKAKIPHNILSVNQVSGSLKDYDFGYQTKVKL